ncbi:hypothetical protein [Salinimonas chungwhensis]|uniref:hypothetical protein n=1 Tax=Salinimonas chungwhensis TaxID=265425 RepID=UPI00037441B2|nr:hypothetical protein [Salinimonas chungwhensis]
MRKLKTILLISFSAFSLNAFAVKSAIFCRDCDTLPKASEFAQYLADLPICEISVPESANCVSSQWQSTTIVDIESGNAFNFSFHEPHTENASPKIKYFRLSAQDIDGYRQLTGFVRAAEDSVRKASGKLIKISSGMQPKTAQTTTSVAVERCPTDTALSALLNASQMEQIHHAAFIRISTELSQRSGTERLEGTIGPEKAAVTINDNRYLGSFAHTTPPHVYYIYFENTERSSPIQDYLAYHVEIIAPGMNKLPTMTFNLIDDSRVAGYTLGGLKGENGPLLIENDCIVEKFKGAVSRGQLLETKTALAHNDLCLSKNNQSDTQANLVKLATRRSKNLKYTYRTCL